MLRSEIFMTDQTLLIPEICVFLCKPKASIEQKPNLKVRENML